MKLNRRDFVRQGSLWLVGTAIVSQEEFLDRLRWTRTLFPSAALVKVYGPFLTKYAVIYGPNGEVVSIDRTRRNPLFNTIGEYDPMTEF